MSKLTLGHDNFYNNKTRKKRGKRETEKQTKKKLER